MKRVILLLFLLPVFCWAQNFDVTTFGAKVDGATDDLLALRSAVAAAAAVRGTVIIPSGTLYLDFRGQPPIALSNAVRIRGQGRNSTIRTNRATPTSDQVLFLIAPGDTAYFNDLSIVGPDSSGTTTSRAIGHAGGLNGLVRVDNAYIEGFSDGVKSDAGTTSIVINNSELAHCGMGVLFTGRLQGKVLISGCTFRDTRPQTRVMEPTKYHGMYIYRQHEINVEGSRFLRITGYGVHLWDGDTTSGTTGGDHLISNCDFDTTRIGILSGSKRGSTDHISNCRFVGCEIGVKMQEGNAEITACEFRTSGASGSAAIVPLVANPGSLQLSRSIFYLPAADLPAPGVLLSGTTSAVWNVSSCIFYGSGDKSGSGIHNRSTGGAMVVRSSEFHGSFAPSSARGAILNEEGTMSVDSSFFDIAGTAVFVVPRKTGTTSTTLTDNTVANGTNFVRVWPTFPGAVIKIKGGGNLVEAGGEFFDCPDSAYIRDYQLANRAGPGGIIRPGGTVTLSRNFDTWHVQGRTTINTILMVGVYHAGEFGPCKIALVADSAFSLSAAGNIIPRTTSPRVPGEVVRLEYDPAVKKWKEVQRETGILTPPRREPGAFVLSRNYPNPFNPTTSIEYSLSERDHVVLEIFSALGQRVALLVSGEVDAGIHKATWNAGGFPSGTYICRVSTSTSVASLKLLLLK